MSEREGFITYDSKIEYIDDTDATRNNHKTLARTLAKKYKITIPEKKDPSLFLLSQGFILFCESCIMRLRRLTADDICLLKEALCTDVLPDQYPEEISKDRLTR